MRYLLLCPAMDYLWTPWRYAYVTAGDKTTGCIFCELPKAGDDAKAHIVHRGQHCYIVLNTYPYTPGHVMVVPFAHLDELQKLPAEAAHEMMDLSQRMERVLRQLYAPDGVNLGMNIGKAAGAGVAGHIHMHVLATLGGGCELCFGGWGNANLAGEPGSHLREDPGGTVITGVILSESSKGRKPRPG